MSAPSLSPEEVIALIAEQIAALGAGTAKIGGRIRFVVPGAGDWLVSLDQAHGRWSKGEPTEPADVTLVIPAEHFAAFLSAPESLAPLVANGAISVSGDVDKLVMLGELLVQRGSPLEQRRRPREEQR